MTAAIHDCCRSPALQLHGQIQMAMSLSIVQGGRALSSAIAAVVGEVLVAYGSQDGEMRVAAFDLEVLLESLETLVPSQGT